MKPVDTANKTYFLDTSALAAMRERYPAAEFPEVWDTLAKLAKEGRAQSPSQTLCELRAKGDAELLGWAEANPKLFHDLDAEQIEVANQIKKRYRKFFEEDEDKSDAAPFVIALAATYRARNGKAEDDIEVSADGPIPSRLELIKICEDPTYAVGFMNSLIVLRELGVMVPAPPGSLIDLMGIWDHLGITEEDIEASRIVFKGYQR